MRLIELIDKWGEPVLLNPEEVVAVYRDSPDPLRVKRNVSTVISLKNGDKFWTKHSVHYVLERLAMDSVAREERMVEFENDEPVFVNPRDVAAVYHAPLWRLDENDEAFDDGWTVVHLRDGKGLQVHGTVNEVRSKLSEDA